MLKGKSKIQLFDGATGRQQAEYIDVNLVTNAVQNLFTPKAAWLMGNFSYKNLAQYCMPLYQKLYGGILLFDGTLPANVNTVIPPATVSEIGHAGGAYAGTNVRRGSYNVNESVAIPGGFRHVWDFATDRANGTIAALSLTSLWGGNVGTMGGGGDTGALFFNPLAITTDYCSAPSVYEPEGDALGGYAGRLSDGRDVWYKATGTAAITLYYVTPGFSGSVTLMGGNTPYTDAETETVTVETTETYSGEEAAGFIDEDMKLHFLYSSYDAATSCRYAVVDLATGTLDSERVVSFPEQVNAYSRPRAVYNNEFILHCPVRNKYCRFSSSGEFIAETAFPIYNNASYFSVLGGRLIYSYQTGAAATYSSVYMWNGTDMTAVAVPRPSGGVFKVHPAKDIPLPYCRPWAGDSGVLAYAPYTATVDNLETPVTKTSAQTMKITYELTSE